MQTYNKMNVLYGLIILNLLVMVSCRKDKCQDPNNPECENYDPCYGKKGNYARFTIYDYEGGGSCTADWFCEDRQNKFKIDGGHFYNNSLLFKADYPNATLYEWTIGAGDYKGESIGLGSMPDTGVVIPVRLIVTYPPSNCKQNDDGKDTFEQKIERKRNDLYHAWKGYDLDKPSEIYTYTYSYARKFYPTINQWRNHVVMKDSRVECYDTFYEGRGGFSNSNKQLIASARGNGYHNCNGYYKSFSQLIDSTNKNMRMKYSYTPPIPGPEGFKFKTFVGYRIE